MKKDNVIISKRPRRLATISLTFEYKKIRLFFLDFLLVFYLSIYEYF